MRKKIVNRGDIGHLPRVFAARLWRWEGKLEFHLRSERCSIRIIGHVEIWNDSENALLFLGCELLSRDRYWVILHLNFSTLSLDPKLDTGQNFELPWFE